MLNNFFLQTIELINGHLLNMQQMWFSAITLFAMIYHSLNKLDKNNPVSIHYPR